MCWADADLSSLATFAAHLLEVMSRALQAFIESLISGRRLAEHTKDHAAGDNGQAANNQREA
jgi:hypothetical protein